MLNNINNDLLLVIFSNLDNYDIIKLMQVSKYNKNLIKTHYFIRYLLRRHHPIVFNKNNIFCNICNIHLYRINDKNKSFIKCKH